MCTRAWFVAVLTFALFPIAAQSQTRSPLPPTLHRPATSPAKPIAAAPMAMAEPAARPGSALAEVTLADIGFVNGLRFANLGGHRELYVPLPQDGEVVASELVLAVDDVSAHEARRNLEVRVNDRTVAAIALDGKSRGRIVPIPLGKVRPKEGYLKVTFLYSGAATLDRCIDVRFVGDSLTIRPETAIEIDVGPVGELDVATTAALMPRDVTIVLPGRRVVESEIASAVTVARSLIASGRRVSFHHGYEELGELSKRDESGRWTRGIVLIGPLAEAANVIDAPLARMAARCSRSARLPRCASADCRRCLCPTAMSCGPGGCLPVPCGPRRAG